MATARLFKVWSTLGKPGNRDPVINATLPAKAFQNSTSLCRLQLPRGDECTAAEELAEFCSLIQNLRYTNSCEEHVSYQHMSGRWHCLSPSRSSWTVFLFTPVIQLLLSANTPESAELSSWNLMLCFSSLERRSWPREKVPGSCCWRAAHNEWMGTPNTSVIMFGYNASMRQCNKRKK